MNQEKDTSGRYDTLFTSVTLVVGCFIVFSVNTIMGNPQPLTVHSPTVQQVPFGSECDWWCQAAGTVMNWIGSLGGGHPKKPTPVPQPQQPNAPSSPQPQPQPTDPYHVPTGGPR